MSDEQKQKDGGPAFPSGEKLSVDSAGRRDDRLAIPLHAGMSLRDYFAAAALPALLALCKQKEYEKTAKEYPDEDDPHGVLRGALMLAWEAFAIADAMLKARQP